MSEGKNKKLPGHKWDIMGWGPLRYKCRRCQATTLAGEPLEGRTKEECR